MEISNALQEELESIIRHIRQETEFLRHKPEYRKELKRKTLRESARTIDDLLEELEALIPPFYID